MIALLILGFSCHVLGDELVEGHHSIRAMGMGGAYTGVVDTSEALFYNPAALSRISGYYWTIMDPYMAINGLEMAQTVQSLQGASDADALRAFYGKNIFGTGGLKSTVSTGHFAFGVYDDVRVATEMNNPAYPLLRLNGYNDMGFAGGFSFPMTPGSAFGLAFRRFQRNGANVPLGATTIASYDASTMSGVTSKGTGYALDLGTMFTVDTAVKPTFSFVWKNVGYTSFTLDEGTTKVSTIKDEMIGGLSLLVETPVVVVSPAIDFKYANRADIQLGKKIHLGVEVSTMLFDVRAGFHQGYYALGAGLDLAFLRLDVATWGVELGEYPGQREDRRIALQLTLELGLDMSFDLFGSGGGKGGGPRRHLKQRR